MNLGVWGGFLEAVTFGMRGEGRENRPSEDEVSLHEENEESKVPEIGEHGTYEESKEALVASRE